MTEGRKPSGSWQQRGFTSRGFASGRSWYVAKEQKKPQNNHTGMVSAFLLLESAVPGSWGRSRAGCCRICITASRGRAKTRLCSHTSIAAIPLPTSAGDLKVKGEEKKIKEKTYNLFQRSSTSKTFGANVHTEAINVPFIAPAKEPSAIWCL